MTLNKLHKRLGKLIEQGYGRRQVLVAKESFRDNRESDGCTYLPICRIGTDWIYEADGDGGIETNKDGSERGGTKVILGGSAYSGGK